MDVDADYEYHRKAAEQPIEHRVKAWLERNPEDVQHVADLQSITNWAAAKHVLDRQENTQHIAQRLRAEFKVEGVQVAAAEQDIEVAKTR